MFRLTIALIVLTAVAAFAPLSSRISNSKLSMTNENLSMKKIFGGFVIASSLLSSVPAFAVEGAGPSYEFFGNNAPSSPFLERDDSFSPYSPYASGKDAVYNQRKGSAEEVKFWANKFENSLKRVDNVPGYVKKQTWLEIRSELTRYAYDLRESALRLAESSKDSKSATAAAKAYFDDLNDINEWAIKKNAGKVLAAYDKSKTDAATFKSLLK